MYDRLRLRLPRSDEVCSAGFKSSVCFEGSKVKAVLLNSVLGEGVALAVFATPGPVSLFLPEEGRLTAAMCGVSGCLACVALYEDGRSLRVQGGLAGFFLSCLCSC